jgi:hypothetical protein
MSDPPNQWELIAERMAVDWELECAELQAKVDELVDEVEDLRTALADCNRRRLLRCL